MTIGGETKLLGRYLDDGGAFSFQMYTSESTRGVTALFYWRHAPGSGRGVIPTLDLGFAEQGFKKLRKGSYFTLDGDGAPQIILYRKYDKSIFNDVTLQAPELIMAFPASNIVTVRMMLPSKTGTAKIQAQGTLDMIMLKQEIAAFGPADIALDTMQANYEEKCDNSDVPKVTPVRIPETVIAPR